MTARIETLMTSRLGEIKIDGSTIIQLSIDSEGVPITNVDVYANGLALYWKASPSYDAYVYEITPFWNICESLLGTRIPVRKLAIFYVAPATNETQIAEFVGNLSYSNFLKYQLPPEIDPHRITFCSFANSYFHLWGEIDGPASHGERIGVSLQVDVIKAVPELIQKTISWPEVKHRQSFPDHLIDVLRDIFAGKEGKGTYELLWEI